MLQTLKKDTFPLFIATLLLQLVSMLFLYQAMDPDEFLLFTEKLEHELTFKCIFIFIILFTSAFFIINIFVGTWFNQLIARFIFRFDINFSEMFKIFLTYLFFIALGSVVIYNPFIQNIIEVDDLFFLYLNPFVAIGLIFFYVMLYRSEGAKIKSLIFVLLVFAMSFIVIQTFFNILSTS